MLIKREAERFRKFSDYPPGKNTKGVAKRPDDKEISMDKPSQQEAKAILQDKGRMALKAIPR